MIVVKRNENYLAHHGRKGQQWGVRNGPPYPLDKKVAKSLVKMAKKGDKKGIEANKYFNNAVVSNNIEQASKMVTEYGIKVSKNPTKSNVQKFISQCDEYNSLCEKAANELVGKIGDNKISNSPYNTYSTSRDYIELVIKRSLSDKNYAANKTILENESMDVIADISAKYTARELKVLEDANNKVKSNMKDSIDYPHEQAANALFVDAIYKKSGDWYNSEGVSEGFKKLITESKKNERPYSYNDPKYSEYEKKKKKIEEAVIDQVAKDIGISDSKLTSDIREAIRINVFYD